MSKKPAAFLVIFGIFVLAGNVFADTEVVLIAENAVKKALIPDGPVDANWTGGNEPFDDTEYLTYGDNY